MNGTDRLKQKIRDAADRYRDAADELHKAVELARDMGLREFDIQQARMTDARQPAEIRNATTEETAP